MSTAKKLKLVSVENYLAGELVSQVKHEYLGGFVYPMAGGRYGHNLIAANIVTALNLRLRPGRCRALTSDMKIRVRLPTQVRFYYPDVPVICRPNQGDDTFQDEPVVLFEVLSRGTRRIDLGEKKDAYLTIPSLKVYVVVEQESASVIAYRRTGDEFVRETYEGLDEVLQLPEIDAELPLREVYEAVEFTPERLHGDDEQVG